MSKSSLSRVRDNSKAFQGKLKDSTRILIQQSALARGAARSLAIRDRVIKAISSIEEDIQASGGCYPLNNGVISAAEVARRASINETTLYSPKHIETLGKEVAEKVKLWNLSITAKKSAKAKKIGRTRLARAADWKDMYGQLAQAHRDTELDLQSAQSKLLALTQEFNSMKQRYRELLAARSLLHSTKEPRD